MRVKSLWFWLFLILPIPIGIAVDMALVDSFGRAYWRGSVLGVGRELACTTLLPALSLILGIILRKRGYPNAGSGMIGSGGLVLFIFWGYIILIYVGFIIWRIKSFLLSQ
jgi:hypothetical protein